MSKLEVTGSGLAVDTKTVQFTVHEPSKPVGYWVLYPGPGSTFQIAVYNRPTDEQIKNTEQLLGWTWVEARP